MDDSIKLPQRPLGKTGLNVSVLGLGTVKFGRNQQIKYPSFILPTDEQIEHLLDDALAMGINLIDTAPAYGTSEERLGRLLKTRRDQFVLVTKTGEEFADGVSTYDFSAAHIEASVIRSLQRLNTSRLDCVLVHCSRQDLDNLKNSAALETLQKLKDRGLLRSFGASINTVEGGLFAVPWVDVLMITHSLEYQSEASVIAHAAKLGKGVLIKKGLGSGQLAQGAALSLPEKIRPILGLTGVTSLITGTIQRDHLRENVLAALSVN